MTIEDEITTSHNGKGKKRNPFRKHSSSSSATASSIEHNGQTEPFFNPSSSKIQGKLRWRASHMGQRDRALSEDSSFSRKQQHWKVPSGKKLHWSPRLGQGKSSNHHDDATSVNAENDETNKSLIDNDNSANLALHWSPKPGRKKNYRDDEDSNVSNVASNGSDTSSLSKSGVELNIPRHVGVSPSAQGGLLKKKSLMWHSRYVDITDSVSDDISEEGTTSTEKVTDRIRRKLNPKGKKAPWINRIGKSRIDEEEEQQLPLVDSCLDPLEGLCRQSLEGDIEVAGENDALFSNVQDSHPMPNRQRCATEPTIHASASMDDREFHRVHSLERNNSPRSIRGGGVSCDSDIATVRSYPSVSSTVATDTASDKRDGASSGISRDGSPTRSKSKTERKGIRVKPYHCFDSPAYLTESQLHMFTLQPSQKVEFLESYIAPSSKSTVKIRVDGETERIWGTTADGRVGSLRVEVLGCIGLASVKPDVAAYLVCGDVPFVTDVIHSCRSPWWPPNCKRAVVFPVHHAYARLFAGVFASKKDKANDEFCGRVVLDLAALRPNTEYDVSLPLRASSFIYDRRPRGIIRLRFSLHWFSERAAVMSYLRKPHSLVASPCGDNPNVLCADPKTFRNVAITVHGQDLPGKYSRKAFQATIREFNLTRLNLIFLVKTLASEAVLYEKPLVSLYLFMTWMHCVYSDSVKLAPAYFVGYLILSLFNNYDRFNRDPSRYLGFAPPTLQEMLYALVYGKERETMRPLVATRKSASVSQRNVLLERHHSGATYGFSDDFNGIIEPLDHREFPFSEKLEYPRFRPEDAIVPNKHSNVSKSSTSDPDLYGRLSSYASEKMSSLQSALPTVSGGDDEDEWEISDNEEEELDLSDSDHMRVDGDNGFLESDDDDDEDEGAVTNASAHLDPQRRIPVGPPQNCDVKPVKKVPPQAVLARAENTLQSLTFGLSMDKLFHSSLAAGKRSSTTTSERDGSAHETPEASIRSRRKSRTPLDDFDKRLGLRNRSKNPVIGIASSFLGPLMRMFRIFLVATRVVFNVGVWKDPFLSFWVLCFLVALMLVLLIFPWRSFMFLAGLICFGPQNILVRRMLLRHAAEAEKAKTETEMGRTAMTDEDSTATLSQGSPSEKSRASSDDVQEEGTSEVAALAESAEDVSDSKKAPKGRRRKLQNKLANMRERRRIRKKERAASGEADPPLMPPRPAFKAATYQKAPKVPLEPRAVVVPYTRVRTERFYDWPPDPTVSRATPVLLTDFGNAHELPIPSGNSSPESAVVRRRQSDEI